MSIYVYISRRADPFNDEEPSITAKEWLLSVDGDSAFRIAREDESKWLGENARIWTGHQHAPAFAFDWVHGQIEVKNPDAQTIAKMQELASKLRAKVFSETGELFDDAGAHTGFLPGFP
jgi:hypothetical protein